jgi:hypothetical protein
MSMEFSATIDFQFFFPFQIRASNAEMAVCFLPSTLVFHTTKYLVENMFPVLYTVITCIVVSHLKKIKIMYDLKKKYIQYQ